MHLIIRDENSVGSQSTLLHAMLVRDNHVIAESFEKDRIDAKRWAYELADGFDVNYTVTKRSVTEVYDFEETE